MTADEVIKPQARFGLCWLSHRWPPWSDDHSVERRNTAAKTTLVLGFQQHRRCVACNRLELRIAWPNE